MLEKRDVFEKMAEAWGAPGFVRPETRRVTGGLIHGKTLANLQSKGEGPPCTKIGNKAYYELETFIPWLREWARTRVRG